MTNDFEDRIARIQAKRGAPQRPPQAPETPTAPSMGIQKQYHAKPKRPSTGGVFAALGTMFLGRLMLGIILFITLPPLGLLLSMYYSDHLVAQARSEGQQISGYERKFTWDNIRTTFTPQNAVAAVSEYKRMISVPGASPQPARPSPFANDPINNRSNAPSGGLNFLKVGQ